MSTHTAPTGERVGAGTVDRAMRVLATGCAAQRRALPRVGAVVVASGTMSLRLTTPDDKAPPGWEAQAHGRTWTALLRWLETAGADLRRSSPYPRLVSLGAMDEGRLLLNLAEANGITSVDGDTDLARRLVASWSRRLTTSPWSAGIRVIRAGFGFDPRFTGLNVHRLVEAAAALDDPEGGVLLLAERPDARDLRLVESVLGEAVPRWSVVAVDAGSASWRFTIGVDGGIRTRMLAQPVRLT